MSRFFLPIVPWTIAFTLLLSAISQSPAAAADRQKSATVQVHIKNQLVCSGSIVARRYVLTSAACITRHGRVHRATRLSVRVRAGSRPVDRYDVAAVSRSSGPRPALALLQLVSTVRVKPLALPVIGRKAPKTGRRGQVQGWRSKRSTHPTAARLVARKRCRGVRVSGQILCGKLPRRGASPNCTNGAGASFVMGKTLVGVGLRGPKGCKRSARLGFAGLSTASTLQWISSTILESSGVTPGTNPTAPGTTSPAFSDPSLALAPFIGHWSGQIIEQSKIHIKYTANVNIDQQLGIGQTVGTTDYPGLPCAGQLVYTGPDADGGVAFVEHLTSGAENCTDGGTLTLALVPDREQVTYTWRGSAEAGRSDGILDRAQ